MNYICRPWIRYCLFILLIGLFFCDILFAKDNKVDSIRLVYENKNLNDSIVFFAYKHKALVSNNPDEKLLYTKCAFLFAQEVKNYNWQGGAKVIEADVYVTIGSLDVAIKTYFESLGLYSKNNYLNGIAYVLSRLGEVYLKNNEIGKAKEYLQRATVYFNNLNDTLRYASVLLNLAEVYRKNGEQDSAVCNFKKSENLFSVIMYSAGIAYAKGNIGLVYVVQNKLDSAEVYLNESISILEPMEDNYAVSSYLDGLAEIYFKRKKYTKAKAMAHKSLTLAQEHGLKEQIKDASFHLASIYSQMGNYKEAYKYKSQYIDYRDSINNEETIRNIANLHIKYEVTQKQKEVDELNAQKQYYLLIAISLVITVGLFVILIVIMLNNSKDRKRVNKQLELQHKELEKADDTKIKFFSILSHDLRGSIGIFSSFSDLIKLYVKNKEYNQLEPLAEEMERSSSNLLDLTDNLLHWGVKQMDAIKSTPTNVKIWNIVCREINYLKSISNKKNISIITDIPEDMELFVCQESLSIALRNLISNALKYTNEKGKVIICAQSNAKNSIVKVSDTGIGMTPEQKQKLFDFNSIRSTYGTHKEKGIGLGLQLVCGFAKSHHAKIEVESEVGDGTTFVLTFPNKNSIQEYGD